MIELKKVVIEVEATQRTPKIGQKVYVIYQDCLFVETVHSLGEKTFVIDSFKANTKSDYWEWRYKDYGIRWFTDFESAKDELLSRFGDDYELVGYSSEWYEVERL